MPFARIFAALLILAACTIAQAPLIQAVITNPVGQTSLAATVTVWTTTIPADTARWTASGAAPMAPGLVIVSCSTFVYGGAPTLFPQLLTPLDLVAPFGFDGGGVVSFSKVLDPSLAGSALFVQIVEIDWFTGWPVAFSDQIGLVM